MARATKPPIRDAWANTAVTSPDIAEAVYVATGFPAPAGVPVVPLRGNFNFEMNRYDTGMIYLFQRGIADWDTGETDYDEFDIVRDPADGKFYQLIGSATPATAPGADPTNWYLCLRVPRPMTGETVADEIAAWYNLKGFRITGKDHYGFNAGRILDFHEDWMDGTATPRSATAASASWFGRWKTAIDNSAGTTGLVYLPGPWADLSTHPWGPLVGVSAIGSGVDAVSIIESSKAIVLVSGASLVFEVAFSINGATVPKSGTLLSFGLGDGTIAANRTMGGVYTSYGAWLELFGSDANWTAWGSPSGGPPAGVNTGVTIARDTPHRYRCYVLGTSDSDSSAARIIHMIDGAVVADQAISLLNQALSPFIRAYAHQTEDCTIFLGPMRAQVRLELGDVLL